MWFQVLKIKQAARAVALFGAQTLLRWLDCALVVCFFTGLLLVAACRVSCAVQKMVQGCRWGLTWRSREHRKDRNMNPRHGLETQKLEELLSRKKPCGAGMIYHKEGRFYGWPQRLEKSFCSWRGSRRQWQRSPTDSIQSDCTVFPAYQILNQAAPRWLLVSSSSAFYSGKKFYDRLLIRGSQHLVYASCRRFLQKACISLMFLETLHSGISPCAFNGVWGNAVKPGCI